MEFYGLLKNQSNVRKEYRHLYNCTVFQKDIPPMDPFFKVFQRMCFTKIRINKEKKYIRSRKKELQHRRKVKGPPELWQNPRMASIKENRSRSHQVKALESFYKRRKLTKYLVYLNIWIRNQKTGNEYIVELVTSIQIIV